MMNQPQYATSVIIWGCPSHQNHTDLRLRDHEPVYRTFLLLRIGSQVENSSPDWPGFAAVGQIWMDYQTV